MKTWKCYRCTMTFQIGKPHENMDADGITRCECGQRFWHAGTSPGPARVGIFPEDHPNWDGF